MQYTHARCCSVLRKAQEAGLSPAEPDFHALADPEAQEVVRLIEQFPSVITAAIDRSEPSQVTRFAVDLAQAYNKFYFERRILDDDPGARAARLMLTAATRDVIKTALYLIGIESPERM